MKYVFGDIVVVEENLIGVILKSWIMQLKGRDSTREKINYEVYVRDYNSIKEYPESKVERYLVRHKYLDEEELEYQFNVINDK